MNSTDYTHTYSNTDDYHTYSTSYYHDCYYDNDNDYTFLELDDLSEEFKLLVILLTIIQGLYTRPCVRRPVKYSVGFT